MKCLRCETEMRLVDDPETDSDRGYAHLLWGAHNNPMFREIKNPYTYSFEMWICNNEDCGYTELRQIRNKVYDSSKQTKTGDETK